VVGDGQHSILELIESQLNSDPRRGHTDDCPLAPVSIDAVARLLLAQRGYTESSVPPAGDRVLIQYNGNLAIDVTDDVHPDVIARLIDAAQVVGLDVAGIDVVAQDIRRPLEEQGGVVVEVNAGPGLHMHLYPSVGKPRPVGEAIVASLYPDDPAGRVPLLVALEGHEDCHVAYAAAEVLNAGSAAAGLSCQRGIYVGMRRLTSPPPRERQAADMLLANNRVESAVVGVTATGILETGLAVDVCDVAIVADQPMNTAASDTDLFDHEWTAAARALVESVARHGAAVVHANDPRLQRLSEGVGEALVLLAEDEKNAMLVEHRAAGRRAVLVRHGQVIAVSGASEVFLASLARLPIDRLAEAGVSVRVLLAAAAAGWVLGRSPRLIRAGLESFAHECLLRHGFDSLSSPAESEVPIGEKDPKAA
jgi:cyanophycin synthetase